MLQKLIVIVVLSLGLSGHVRGETQLEADIKGLYDTFLTAQNARDLVRVRDTLWESPGFVWISDGKAFWGRDALIERMSAFQQAEIWSVTPDKTRSRVVEVSPVSAFLYQPLRLTLGSKADAKTIDFLVNVLCVRTPQGWRVAALFTTEENPN